MSNRIRLALFDHCQLRRSAITKVLHHSGRYRVMLQGSPHDIPVGRIASLRADGALVATGAAPAVEHAVIHAAGGRRLPVVAYAVQAVPAAVANAGPHVCAQLRFSCDTDALLLALERLFTIGCHVCRPPLRQPEVVADVHLSVREREVLYLLECGASCKLIAAQLALSEKTVYTYVARARAKRQQAGHASIMQAMPPRATPVAMMRPGVGRSP